MSKAKKRQIEELHWLAKQPDTAIDTDDMPEVTDWRIAERGHFYRPIKQQVTLRIDADVLAWFKSRNGKYQARINAALREYIASHRDAE